MSQSPTPIRRGADARDTEAFAKQIAASLLTQNDAPQPVSPVPETKKPLIEMHGIRKSYYIGRPNELEILHGIDLTVYPGEFVAIVGQSGSGKSTAARCVMNLVKPQSGHIFYQGIDITDPRQFAANKKLLQTSRQMIFQDSTSSLNGRMKVADIIAEPMRIHHIAPPRGTYRKEAEFQMYYVGLDKKYLDKYPSELSGGQRQRVAIARALCMEPELLVADEPIASLDVSIQAQIVNLFRHLQREHGFSFLFIAHDLAMVEFLCDRVGVLYHGKLVEVAPVRALYDHSLHPYTKALLSAIPIPRVGIERQRIILKGDVPSPVNLPDGCRFAGRCPYAQERCFKETPELREVAPGRFVACHLA